MRNPGRIVGLLSMVLLMSTRLALAQEAVFHVPPDPIFYYARNICLILLVVAMLVVLFVLLRRPNRLMEGRTRLLLLFGLVILPLPAALLSGGVGMERSKELEFCHSCHEPMDPFVNDMQDPESDTLAAVHYKNRLIQHEQCWHCHSDYGITGTAEAKMTGLKHIYYYATNTWHAPIALYGDYKWTICLECHAESERFKAPGGDPENHEGVLEGVLGGEIGCTECHEMAHPAREERSTKP